MKSLYFDYCATTPLHPQVRQAMAVSLDEAYGNPSSMHLMGQRARHMVDKARLKVASEIGATSEEIIFTSGATEANNMALLGVMQALAPEKNHLITSAIEHHAILHTAQALENKGFQVSYLPVDKYGRVDPDEVRGAIREDTGLISIMLVNNETGAIQPVPQISQIAHKHGILMHTDAVQALGCLTVNVDALGADLMSLSAHKIYGPKGIGALYLRQGTPIQPLLHGGSQERKLRPGTENVPGIVGLGAAVELVSQQRPQAAERLTQLRALLVQGLQDTFPGVIINGPKEQVSPHVVSVSFPGVVGEMLLFHLSRLGIAASMGSACTAEDIEPSHVLMAMGLPLAQIEGTLRLSMGYATTTNEIEQMLTSLLQVIAASLNE